MLLERAELLIKPGVEDEFAATMQERALPLLRADPGVVAVQFGRGVENPSKFMLLVEWTSLEAHAAFKSSATYMPFVQTFGPYSEGGAMEHFEMR